MNSTLESRSYLKRFVKFLAFLSLIEIVQVWFRHEVYFANTVEAKWLIIRDIIAIVLGSLLGARITRRDRPPQ